VSRYIDEHRERFGVEPICRTLGVSASAYYQRATGERSAREVEDERLLEVIRTTHKKNYEAYGYRRMWKALRRAGERVARCRVQRLMRANGIQGAKRRGKPWRTTKPDPVARRPRDLVQRDFTAPAPNRLWVGDFTYLRCWEGVVYFSFVIDVFSRMVVGWQLAVNMRTTLVLDAVRMALGLREPGADFQLVAHTDAGSQGGFKWLSQRSIEGSCGGSPEASEVGSGGAAVVAVAGSAAGRAAGAPGAVLGGDRSRVVECGRGGRGGRVGGGWCPMVSRVWGDAAVCDSFLALGALSVVRRARGDSAAARPGLWGAGGRAAARPFAVDDLS
jgi:putative transposase